MAAFIDPAESFSNALNQGLGVFKSYREEARQDEDRAFEKAMKLDARRQAQKQLELLINADRREQSTYDFENSDEMRGFRTQSAKGLADKATAEAKDAGILATNRQSMIDHDQKMDRGRLSVDQFNAQTSRINSNTSRGELGLRTRMYNDERADRIASQQLRAGWQAIGLAAKNPTPENMRRLVGDKIAGSALIKLAAKAYDAPVLEEIMQNPFGNWINNGKKLGVALRFARDTEVVNATTKAQGFNPAQTRVANIRGTTQKDANGRPMQMVELTLRGPDARTGKIKTFTGVVRPETLFETGAVAANVFKGINNDIVLKGRMVQMFQNTHEKEYYDILNYEASRIEKEMKNPTNRDVLSGKIPEDAYQKALAVRLAKLEDGDPNITTDLVFRFMGRMGS
jgi:hypothetical protein